MWVLGHALCGNFAKSTCGRQFWNRNMVSLASASVRIGGVSWKVFRGIYCVRTYDVFRRFLVRTSVAINVTRLHQTAMFGMPWRSRWSWMKQCLLMFAVPWRRTRFTIINIANTTWPTKHQDEQLRLPNVANFDFLNSKWWGLAVQNVWQQTVLPQHWSRWNFSNERETFQLQVFLLSLLHAIGIWIFLGTREWTWMNYICTHIMTQVWNHS